MEMYKRIASLTTQADREDITDELLDRFGEVPPVVETLLDVAQVRVLANQLGVSLVTYKRGGFLVMKLNAEYMPDQAAFIPAMAMTDKRLMPSTTAPDVLLLVDPTLGEYAMLSEAVKVLGKLNENVEMMLKSRRREKNMKTLDKLMMTIVGLLCFCVSAAALISWISARNTAWSMQTCCTAFPSACCCLPLPC